MNKSNTSPPENAAEVIRRAVMYHVQQIHTMIPGRIVSVNKNVAKVQPLLRRVWSDGTESAMPIVHNVPIQWPRTAAGSLVFKVVKGDLGSLICAERSLDEYLQSGGEVSPKRRHTHSLTDAVFVPGLVPHSRNTGGDDDVRLASAGAAVVMNGSDAEFAAGGAKLTLRGGKIALGAGGTELLDIVEQLLQLLGASVTTGPGTPIASQAAYLALAGQLQSIKGTL